MKILYHTGQLRIMGGIERVLSMKLNYLAEHTPHEVFLVTYEQCGFPYVFPISSKVKTWDIGVDYNVDYTRESLYSTKFIKKIPSHISRLKKIVNQIKPDVIIIPNFGFEYYFLPFVFYKTPIVREFHDSQYRRTNNRVGYLGRLKRRFEDYIEQKYSALVVLTKDECQYFKNTDNLWVIPNPVLVTDDFINPPRKQIAITAGRLSAVKGYDRLIEIWAHVSPEIRGGWALHIYGDGEEAYKSLLYRRIQAYSLNDSVQLKGNTLQILEKFKEASVYLCTSQTESFGMTLVEAESCGLPVISFDCPHGPKNIINHTCDGFLVEDFSIDKFAHYLELILGNSELRQNMGREALANSKRFSTARVMSQWLENLYSIINNPN